MLVKQNSAYKPNYFGVLEKNIVTIVTLWVESDSDWLQQTGNFSLYNFKAQDWVCVQLRLRPLAQMRLPGPGFSLFLCMALLS